MTIPKVNETIHIQHTTRVNPKNGIVSIVGAHRFVYSKIKHVYGSGRVQVASGDVWSVMRSGDGWVTQPEEFQ